MRVLSALALIASLGALSACSPSVPDSGFDDLFGQDPEQQAREAALAGQAPYPDTSTGSLVALPPASGVEQQPLAPATVDSNVAAAAPEDLAAETAAALSATAANSGVPPVQASPSNPVPPQVNNAGISDENDFAAVASRQSIQSDATRIEANKQAYQQVAPTALPQREGAEGPNIVAYALAANHPKGVKLYSRAGLNQQARAERNCNTFSSPDQAQQAFLEAGGPERDKRGLDPDGDGYACAWDPAPFRKAVNN